MTEEEEDWRFFINRMIIEEQWYDPFDRNEDGTWHFYPQGRVEMRSPRWDVVVKDSLCLRTMLKHERLLKYTVLYI